MEYKEFTESLLPMNTGHSSKGNQLKFHEGNFWYKADYMGYEGLSEVICSLLLTHSNVSSHVIYSPVWIGYEGKQYLGCKSAHFLKPNEEIITLDHLFRQYTGLNLTKELAHIPDIKRRLTYVVELVENFTGLEDFGAYLTMMLEIDTFFLNEDRHVNNIAVLYDTKDDEFHFCPYFDMGLSLFSDIKEDFPYEKEIEECFKSIKAKPFSRDFDEQLDAAQDLYGHRLHFTLPLRQLLEKIDALELPYNSQSTSRVKDILRIQGRKYSFLFTN